MADKLKQLQDAVNYVQSDAGLKEVGDKLADLIKDRVKSGKGVKRTGGNVRKLKPLSDRYKEERKRLKSKGILSSDTSPDKSNFHRTGDTVDSIKASVSGNSIQIKTDRKNQHKIEDQKKQGRIIMNISKTEIKDTAKIIGEIIVKRIKG